MKTLEALLWAVVGGAAAGAVPVLGTTPVNWQQVGSAAGVGAILALAAFLRDPNASSSGATK